MILDLINTWAWKVSFIILYLTTYLVPRQLIPHSTSFQEQLSSHLRSSNERDATNFDVKNSQNAVMRPNSPSGPKVLLRLRLNDDMSVFSETLTEDAFLAQSRQSCGSKLTGRDETASGERSGGKRTRFDLDSIGIRQIYLTLFSVAWHLMHKFSCRSSY